MGLLGTNLLHRFANVPGGIGHQAKFAAGFEAIDRFEQTTNAFLKQIFISDVAWNDANEQPWLPNASWQRRADA